MILDPQTKQDLFGHLKIWRRALSLVIRAVPFLTMIWLLLLVILGGLPAITIYFTKFAVDSFVSLRTDVVGGNKGQLFFYVGLVAVSMLCTEAGRLALDWIRVLQTDKVTDHIKNLIHKKAGDIDFGCYESADYHDLLEQARGESLAKPLGVLENLGAVGQSTITLFTFVGMLSAYGWWLPLVLCVGALPAFFIALHADKVFHEWWKKTAPVRRWSGYFDVLLTHPNAAAEMRIFSLNSYFRERYIEFRSRLYKEKSERLLRQFIENMAASLVALVLAGTALTWMAIKVVGGFYSLGDLTVFYQVLSRGQSSTRTLFAGVGKAFTSNLYLENLFSFLDLKPTLAAPLQPASFPVRITAGIRFVGVTFAYPGEKSAALIDFNLFIPAGKVVAIVGSNGAGKSTLVKLLCRFYDPQEGRIEIDGIDIRRFDPSELRRNLAVYFQIPIHYQATVEQNISFGDIASAVNPDLLAEAAQNAGAHSFISDLPNGYQALLGRLFEGGRELSSGQWQRIALARSYYRRSPILVLDEPTSYMDSWAEVDWFKHLENLVSDRTGLIITHRFTIAMRADIIHVMDESRLVEMGTHETLVQMNGFYAKSWNAQLRLSERNSTRFEQQLKLDL